MVRPRYEYCYDAYGNQLSIRDNVVHVSPGLGSYDHDGQPGDDTRRTLFAYNSQGRQLSRTLPLGAATPSDPTDFVETRQYNDLGQLVLEISFEGLLTRYGYDSDNGLQPGDSGRLVAKQYYPSLAAYSSNPNTPAEVTSYQYDCLGRTVEVFQDAAEDRTTLTTYDADGRVLRLDSSTEGVVNYRYDPVSGERTETWTGTNPMSPTTLTRYELDPLSRVDRVLLQWRGGEWLDDSQGRPTPEVTDYQYDVLGNLQRVRHSNGMVSDYVYDALGRLDKLVQYAPDTTPGTLADNPRLAEYDYAVRPDGKRTGVTEKHWFNSQERQSEFAWTYDAAGRLVDEVLNHYDDTLDGSTHYEYDLVGNRLLKTLDKTSTGAGVDESTSSLYDANDRLLTEAADDLTAANVDRFTRYQYGPGATSSPLFGGNGTQQTVKTVTEGLVPGGALKEHAAYAYNLQGRMAQAVVDSDGNGTTDSTSQYQYADDGTRVAQTVDGVRTLYLVDPQNPTGYSQVLEEKNASGVVTKTYTLGLDVIAQQAPAVYNNKTLTLVYDGHGSTRTLAGPTGAILFDDNGTPENPADDIPQLFTYDAFGNRLDSVVPLTTLLYSGEQTDQATGLQLPPRPLLCRPRRPLHHA